jgi:hypothetical protein
MSDNARDNAHYTIPGPSLESPGFVGVARNGGERWLYCLCIVVSNYSLWRFVCSISMAFGSIVASAMAGAMEFTNFPTRGRAIS